MKWLCFVSFSRSDVFFRAAVTSVMGFWCAISMSICFGILINGLDRPSLHLNSYRCLSNSCRLGSVRFD